MLKNLLFRKIFRTLAIMPLIFLNAGSADAQWTAVRFDSTNTFHKVFAASPNTAFVTGTQPGTDENFLLRTNDGGDNWDWITLNTATDTFELSSLFFVDANNGFAGGRKNNFQALLKTDDNGSTWTDITPNPSSVDFIACVYFVSPQTGFASDGYSLYKTINGGTSWATETPAFVIQDLHFDNLSDGIAAGNDGSSLAVVMKTTDGGQSWNNLLSAQNPNLFVNSFGKLDVVSPTVFFTSMQFTNNLYRTLDAGLTWDTIAVDSVDFVGDFDFVTQDAGHILGVVINVNEYKLLTTSDAGQNSTLEYTTGWNFYGGGVELNSISFSGGTGFAAATKGLIKKYSSSATRIEEAKTNEAIFIYPNPASSTIRIQTAGIQQLEIHDALGRLLFSASPENITEKNLTVDMNGWNSGIYFVRGITGNRVNTGRFVKE
jgi:photosystem II stability/assembly factor-like uncharacterized protein